MKPNKSTQKGGSSMCVCVSLKAALIETGEKFFWGKSLTFLD